MITKPTQKPKPNSAPATAAEQQTPKHKQSAARASSPGRGFEHGFHNVSRWMTWLPISLKNAAKCDKWYQLQNHSITESLNANGAREKPSTAIPVHAVSLSVEQKPNSTRESRLVHSNVLPLARRLCGRVVTPNPPSNRRFMGNSIFLKKLSVVLPRPGVGGAPGAFFNKCKSRFYACAMAHKPSTQKLFCYRPECGRITRRT